MSTPVLVSDEATRADPPPAESDVTAVPRFYALDALRGLAIGLMIFVNWPGNRSIPAPFTHSQWHGLTLADTVFPAFLVAMGTAMPFAQRTGWRRAFGRAAMLYLIGSALVSFKSGSPFQLTVGVLQLIAVTYLLSWLILRLPRIVQVPVVVLVLLGVSATYFWVTPPGVVPGSFEPGTNVGEWIDAWLGMSPHPENPHAWLPALGSVFIGVLAGQISLASTGRRRISLLAALGAGTLALGLLLRLVVPVNKFLWTPSFMLVTGGLAVLTLVVLAVLIPPRTKGGPLRPLVILGGHAIIVYAFSETVIARSHDVWFGPQFEHFVWERWGEMAGSVAFPAGAVLASLLLAWLMERLRIHIRL